MRNFATPHCHVQSLDSASTPQAFAERELELDTGVITVTDHGSLAACQAVYELAREKKLTPVLGLEGYFRDDNCPILLNQGVSRVNGKFDNFIKYHHFTTHFLDQAAFQVGVKLLSRAPIEKHGSESKPLFNWSDMEELGAANTTITTGCLIGMVQRFLLDKQSPELAIKYYERLRALVKPGNMYVEVFPHICSHNWVDGVFLTLKEGDGAEFKLRFYSGKTLKTNAGEIKASDLATEFNRKGNKHDTLLAVKDYHTWNDRTPATIVDVQEVVDEHGNKGAFIQNECRPFAPDGDVQLGANQFMLEMAQKYGDPILVSDDSHYAHPEEKIVQDVRLAQSGSWRFYGSYHRQSSAEAFEYFKNKLNVSEKQFEGWVENSHAWASRFKDFRLEAKPSLPTKFYEEKYAAVGATNSLEYTLHLIKKRGRFVEKPEYRARLNQEIKLLYANGVIDLLPYFFIDEEVCDLYTRNNMLTGPGRGSAAGLLLTYYLGITHVDPIRYGLSLDRFLTLDRIKSGKLPDIDQDLPSRDLLVGPDGKHGWLHERFGDHVAQISTVMTLRLRNAVLDVTRFTLGKVPPVVSDLTRKFLMPPQGLDDHKFVFGYEDSGAWVDGSIVHDTALQEYVRLYPNQWKIVQKCLGLGRGVSRHACAYVIANKPIVEMGIPLTKISDVTCTAFTASAVEAMGGLKMDFLVINSLNDIAAAIKMIQDRSGLTVPEDGTKVDGRWVPSVQLVPYKGKLVDIWDLPPAQEVFADIATSKTETVFQFNTHGAQQWLRNFAFKKDNGNYTIDSVDEMAAFTALDRPGPLDAAVTTPGQKRQEEWEKRKRRPSPWSDTITGGVGLSPGAPIPGFEPDRYEDEKDGKVHNMLVEYARRARGLAPSPDIFAVFDKLFPETHGVMVYQEQLQRLYQEVTGCSGAEAEEFRSNVAKKKKEKIIEAYPKFIEGGTKSMGSKAAAESVWQFIQSWAAYGFNKSHAVCYSVVGYACAFLKHFYPLEWWTAVLRNATKEEINESFWRHCGHLINLPDVTRAHNNFAIVGDRIQAPLSLLQGVGEVAHQELVAGAPYTSMADLVAKIEQKKIDGTRPGKVKKTVKEKDPNTGEETKKRVEVDGTIKGRSALNRGIVYKLIISGAMDKLFDEELTTNEMLAAYEKACFDYEQAARVLAGKKPSKKAAPPPVDKRFTGLNQYTRYQLRKEILPAYSESVLKSLVERKHERIFLGSRGYVYKWSKAVSFGDPEAIARLSAVEFSEKGQGIRVAVAAYVSDVRIFRYGDKKQFAACDLSVDVDGERMKFVRWPTRETDEDGEEIQFLDHRFTPELKGALVILVLGRFKTGRQFSIDDIEVIQPAYVAKTEEETEAEESKE
jgi:DNA polymerase III alpha subunit